jgi:hypothetical protein
MNTLEAVFAIAIGSVGVWMVISAIVTGVIKGEDGHTVDQAKRPSRFWLEVAIGIIISSACISFAIWKLALP